MIYKVVLNLNHDEVEGDGMMIFDIKQYARNVENLN